MSLNRSTPSKTFNADNLDVDLPDFTGKWTWLVSKVNDVVARINAIAKRVRNIPQGGGNGGGSETGKTDVICVHEDGERVLLTVVVSGQPSYPDRRVTS